MLVNDRLLRHEVNEIKGGQCLGFVIDDFIVRPGGKLGKGAANSRINDTIPNGLHRAVDMSVENSAQSPAGRQQGTVKIITVGN